MRKIIIEDGIFLKYPDFVRGIIVVGDMVNYPQHREIQELLDNEISVKKGQNMPEHEFVNVWNKVHESFGSNPNKFPPSIKSLVKRIIKSGEIPFINSVVALFNFISIKYLIPCGGDDTKKIEGNLKLGFAKGNEFFLPLGGVEKESPEAGEVIYYDDKTLNVMCRRWNWRNGDFTKIIPETKKMVINIDGIGPVSRAVIAEARDELADLLTKYCRAEIYKDILDKDKKQTCLPAPTRSRGEPADRRN